MDIRIGAAVGNCNSAFPDPASAAQLSLLARIAEILESAERFSEESSMSSSAPASWLPEAMSFHEDLIAWRRTVHQNPELSFCEEETSRFVAGVLRGEGISFREGVGGFGVVAEIRGSAGPMVGLRADMDALPIQEESWDGCVSGRLGVMHACGHDAHVAMLLGAARLLKRRADAGELQGSVRLIFQPAEEAMDGNGKSGASHMIAEGILEGLSAVFALHVSPSVEAGRVSFVQGAINASSDVFEIIVRGKSAHGAMPHQGVDAIVAASAVVLAAQQVVSRRVNSFSSGVLSIGTIQGGTADNVIADEVRMKGTLRALDEETRRVLKEGLAQSCQTAGAYGAEAELILIEGYPVGRNDAALTEFAERVAVSYLGADAVHPSFGPAMGAEDFSFLSAQVPGSLIRVGVKHPDWKSPKNLHTPGFQIDESALATGAIILAALAAEYGSAGLTRRRGGAEE